MECIYAYRSGLKVWVLHVQDTFRPPPVISVVVSIYLIISTTVPQIPVFDASSGVWHEIHSPWPLSQNWFSYSLFPLTEEGGYFRFWDPSQSFGFYLLPSPVRRFVRATICPCTPFFTHPVTKCKHLLVCILIWICYFRIDLHYLS